MTACSKSRRLKRGVCIGAMDRLVTLKSRAIQSPSGGSVDYSEDFDSLGNAWANMRTTARGPIFFDDTNNAKQVTHIFQIRYRDDMTPETWIELDGVNYDILNVEDLEERHEFLFLYAVQRGDASLPINQV